MASAGLALSGTDGLLQLATDGLLQLLILGDETQPEEHGADQPDSRAGRLGATCAPVPAPVQGASLAPVPDRRHATAQAAPHPSGENVAAPPLPGGCTSVHGRERRRGDERVMVARVPLAVEEHLPEIDAGVRDRPGRGVLHAGELLDPGVAETLRTEVEDPADGGRVGVGHELSADEVVAELRPVRPPTLTRGLVHAEADVLRELLPVELRECPEDVVEHAPGRRGEIQLLGERVKAHPVLPESIGQQDQVAQIPGEPIQAPHEHVGYVPLFHHGQQLLESGPLEVLARASRVLDDGHGSKVVELGIRPELLGLAVD